MNRAIFLVGGPGSGKDLILKEALSNFKIMEFNTEQVKNIVKKFFREIVVITGNAYNFDKIKESKEILENAGYLTSMIYVDVSDDISKERLYNRNISEDVRFSRLSESKSNFILFSELFSELYLIRNDFSSESEEIRFQINSLIEKLSEDLRIGATLRDKRKRGIQAKVDSIRRADKKQHADVHAEITAKKLKSTSFKKALSYHNAGTKKAMKNLNNFKQRIRHESSYVCPNIIEGFANDKETDKLNKLKKRKLIPTSVKLGDPVRGSGIGPTYDLRNSGEYRLGGMLNTMASEDYTNCDDFFDEAIDSPSVSDVGFPGVEGSSSSKMPLTKQSSSYVYSTKKKKTNFQKDKESVNNEDLWGRSRNILFKESCWTKSKNIGIRKKIKDAKRQK